MATSLTRTVSEEEYLSLERHAVEKSEYIAGNVFAMSGGAYNHSRLAIRMSLYLESMATDDCFAFSSDMRIHIPAARAFTYPDCGVVCGEPQFFKDQQDVLLNPTLLVEVLSPSSESYDRGKKFDIYKNIASLRDYLLVHQDRRRVEHYTRRSDNGWFLHDYSGDGCIVLETLNMQIAISDLYSRTSI